MSAIAPVIQLAGLTKAYNVGTPVETEVLHGIDFALAEGEFAALIGPSGSGKSTLLNIIGLLERPTGGRLSIAGRDTATLSEAEITQLRGRSIGFVFQFHHLLPAFSALENVMMPTIIARGHPDDEAEATALQLLDAVGLKAHARKKPAELSGGQQQRVAIARALARHPHRRRHLRAAARVQPPGQLRLPDRHPRPPPRRPLRPHRAAGGWAHRRRRPGGRVRSCFCRLSCRSDFSPTTRVDQRRFARQGMSD